MSNTSKHIFLFKKCIILFVFFLFKNFLTYSQLSINTSKSPNQLVSDILIGSGVNVSNITFKGDKSIGISEFRYLDVTGSNNLGLESGILLSTGDVKNASGINVSQNTGSQGSSLSDKDLDSIIQTSGKKTTDAIILEFDFVPMSDSIQFKYVFASEEYPEFNCSSFNDIFAFLLSGPNPNGGANYSNKNLAIVPNTLNTNVSINTINSGSVSSPNSESICDGIDGNWKSFSKYFIANYPNLPASNQLTFDGLTIPLEAKAAVKCGETYHLKIAIADVGDQNYDSGVFLLANSLFSNIITAETKIQKNDQTIYSDSIIVKNCSKGILTFKLGKKSLQNTVINYLLKGAATNGIDYENLSGSATIPALQDSVQIFINPNFSNVTNDEDLIIEFNAGGCAGIQKKTFIFKDNPKPPITNFSYDSIICLNSESQFVQRKSGFVKGGVFTSNSSDLNLNTITGKITPSLSKPGDYKVTYKVNQTSICDVAGETTIDLKIKDMENPKTKFSYNSPICKSLMSTNPILESNFSLGGKFFSVVNLKIDSLNGVIDLTNSNPGIYKVFYKYEKNACYNNALDSSIIEIVDSPKPVSNYSYASPICKLDQNPKPTLSIGFTQGGEFKTDSIKLIFKNNSTGEIDLSLTPIGTYNIYYEFKNNQGCIVKSDMTWITIIDNNKPSITFKYEKYLCVNSGKKVPIINNLFTRGGEFSSDDVDLKIDPQTGEIDLNNSLTGNYKVKYSLKQTNCNSAIDTTVEIVVENLSPKNTDFTYKSPVCITGSNPTPTGNFDLGGEFSGSQGITVLKNGTVFLGATIPGTYEITYTIQSEGCFSKSVGKASITIESSATPVTSFSYDRPICLNSKNTLPILPTGFSKGGKFSTSETEIVVDENTGKLDLSKSKGGITYKIDYTIISSACGGSGSGTTEVLIADLLKPKTNFDYEESLFCVNTLKKTPKLESGFEINGNFSSNKLGLDLDTKTGEINFLNSIPGIYDVKYKTNEKSCFLVDSTIKEITISQLPIVNLSTNNPICIGDTLKLKSPSYVNAQYHWVGPNNFSSTDSLPILTSLTLKQKGIYRLTIKKNNCIDSANIDVDIKDVTSIPISMSGPFCKNDTNLYKIQASVKGGKWSGIDLPLDKNDSTIVYFRPSNSSLDSFLLSYKTDLGCGGLGTAKIINNSLPKIEFDISSKEGCAPVNVKLLIPKQLSMDSCQWFIDNEKMNLTKDSSVKFSKQGYFNVKVLSFKNGCMSSLQKDTILKVYPYPIADYIVSDTILSMFTPHISLTNKSINATKFNWYFSDGKTSTLKNPEHIFPIESTDYFVTLYASQRGFCEDSKTIHITVPTELTVYVPNTFTPNDDDLNETFNPIISDAIDPMSYSFMVFNRWGEIVFISYDKSIGWKGTYNGKICIDGVYTWKIEFIDNVNNKKHKYVGHLNLIK